MRPSPRRPERPFARRRAVHSLRNCRSQASAEQLGCPTMAVSVTRNPNARSDAERAAILADPGFGRYFTDHMVRIDWTADGGWGDIQVQPYGPLQLDPATSALHYVLDIFEGLKAYRQPDGSIAAFRPE